MKSLRIRGVSSIDACSQHKYFMIPVIQHPVPGSWYRVLQVFLKCFFKVNVFKASEHFGFFFFGHTSNFKFSCFNMAC